MNYTAGDSFKREVNQILIFSYEKKKLFRNLFNFQKKDFPTLISSREGMRKQTAGVYLEIVRKSLFV